MKGIQQEETERTEKIDLKAPFFPGEHRVHPLFEMASALTETIIAAAIEVHRNKGPGLIESIYEWCLMKELELRSVNCVSQRVVVVEYKGFTRGEPLRFDLLIEGCVLGGGESCGEDSPHSQRAIAELHEVAQTFHSGCSLTSTK